MAPRFSLLILLSIFFLLSLSTDARPFHPCNTNTLIVSTYTISLRPQNPNFPDLDHPNFIAFSSDIHRDFPHPRHHLHHHLHHLRPGFAALEMPEFDKTQLLEDHFPALGFSSLKDRTMDILSVVISLLFGAACGALTAATMYLIWSLFNHRYGSYRSVDGFNSDDDDNDDDDDDIFNPKKKKGYVAIPAADSAAKVPAPVNESV